MRRITIHDVAAKAGVSLATVDRVLNNRPGVRQITIEKVQAAVRTLNYIPDVHAANLAKRRTYRLKFLLPNSSNGFMQDLVREVEDRAAALTQERILIEIIPIDAFDAHAVTGTLAILDKSSCDGVAVVAPAFPEVRAAVDRLQERGVHVVTLISDHPASARQHFIGINNDAAGRVAGRLLGRFLTGHRGKVAFLAGSLGLRDHAERYAGCTRILREEFPDLTLLPVQEGRDDSTRNAAMLKQLLNDHPDLIGLYNMGAGNQGLIDGLQEVAEVRPIAFVAHELTSQTRQALETGIIDAVIAQDPGHEVRSAIRVLKSLCDGAPIVEGQERIRIDIFLKDNLPDLG
ncbi:substrate-binding domain-containing protein [Roseibium sp. CAU 1637]|uniref:Substrate-binding domain-containing protein n=1 Tax=Roseibium limicola TaxID=2816037 RepID=A0A939J9U0_9HYPH|nr:substrate-binding domain-containing protein [Roseibium limicola]MBO0345743.1 substrate-binding domain-containing protein [Roseibium limicola]